MSLLTKKDAMKYLGIGKARFERILKSGDLKYKLVGRSAMFTERNLEEWLNTPDNPSKSTSAGATGTLRCQPSSTGKEYSFAKVRTQKTNNRRNDTRSNGSISLWSRPNTAPTRLN